MFCSQPAQTGAPELFPGQAGGVAGVLTRAGQALSVRRAAGQPQLELAFFGGTFTGQSAEDMAACLAFAAHWKKQGVITRARCSTRPDRVDLPLLRHLASAGLDMVELGVQSFSDAALAASNRMYTGEVARRAAAMVLAAGLDLGIQLMPGMPGVDRATADEDVAAAIACKPSCVRLYPCLVLAGTELARLWAEGRYRPWELDQTLDYLADALLSFWGAGIHVIRMGLAPEDGLKEAVLAGPEHPALGARARGLALARHVAAELSRRGYGAAKPFAGVLMVPARSQGEFWGHRGELQPFYAALGVVKERVRWWDEEEFALALG